MDIPKVLNEWMRRYIAEPQRFAREWHTVSDFQKAEQEGREPDYGTVCHDYLQQIATELNATL